MAGTPDSRPAGRGDPRLAALLTWFAPGAGHLYLGLPLFGLLAFVVVEGLFVLGLRLSQGMLLEYLEPDLQGPFAGALTPEVGNLGMLVYQMRAYGFGPGAPRPWPPHMALGVTLTAVGGLMNAFLIVQAMRDAQRPSGVPARRPSPALLVAASWLVPGLGHVLQKRYLRAAILFTGLVGLFLLGTMLSHGSNLDRERHFYYWAGQFLIGAPALLAEAWHGHALVTSEIPYVDGGLGMACVAGLLNVLAMIDVYNRADGSAAQEPAPTSVAPAPAVQPGTLA